MANPMPVSRREYDALRKSYDRLKIACATQAEQIKGLKAALRKYGGHIQFPLCGWLNTGSGICTCGFEQALKGGE